MFEQQGNPDSVVSDCRGVPGGMPGGAMATVLERVNLSSLDDSALRHALVATQKMTAWSQARHADVVAEMARRARQEHATASPTGVATVDCDPYRFVADEIAAELAVSKGAGSGRLSFALEMQAHPGVAEALRQGRVDRGKAEEICVHLERLESPTFAEILERGALDYAQTTPAPNCGHG